MDNFTEGAKRTWNAPPEVPKETPSWASGGNTWGGGGWGTWSSGKKKAFAVFALVLIVGGGILIWYLSKPTAKPPTQENQTQTLSGTWYCNITNGSATIDTNNYYMKCVFSGENFTFSHMTNTPYAQGTYELLNSIDKIHFSITNSAGVIINTYSVPINSARTAFTLTGESEVARLGDGALFGVQMTFKKV